MSIEEEDDVGEAVSATDEREEEDLGDDGEDEDFYDWSLLECGPYNAKNINDEVFEELVLPEDVIEDMGVAWTTFLGEAESNAFAGDAIYAAIFDAAPALQGLFKTPRAVSGLRFVNSLNVVAANLRNPKAMKGAIETLGFQHLDTEVTIPRIVVFRDAIIQLLIDELGTVFSDRAKAGWCIVLNYMGGAFIHVRVKYAVRLRCLAASWAQASSKGVAKQPKVQAEEGLEEDGTGGVNDGAPDDQSAVIQIGEEPGYEQKKPDKNDAKNAAWSPFRIKKTLKKSSNDGSASASNSGSNGENQVYGEMNTVGVPKTFQDMFIFNLAVMGFASSGWMLEVLTSFDAIVTNISISLRLQEECDILSLRIAKYKGAIHLNEFKAVMLSSLRSLVKEWGSLHETSWSWLWENVERMLTSSLGKPAVQESALSRFLGSLEPETLSVVRNDIYKQFFAVTPAGQDYFKQSTTRLHFIADRVFAFSLEMYREPKRMVDDLSALGLRHVGYGIPTEMFGPFVTACVQVMGVVANDEAAMDALSWSLTLISRILVRVITEGSTIVMQAINLNSDKQIRKAAACAPRNERASWMLRINVGTQSISPLLWAIESGSFNAARAIISDLLTIRADRDNYYYGMDALFMRHPDIIQRLCLDAPAIMPVLLDGLVWRSRITVNSKRRVNYYIKHLVVDSEGAFAKATEWIVALKDPNIAIHPVVSLVSDMVWNNVALRTFLFRRAWFLLNLIVFLFAQSILHYIDCSGDSEDPDTDSTASTVVVTGNSTDIGVTTPSCVHGFEVRLAIILFRGFIYTFSMMQMVFSHAKRTLLSIKRRDFFAIGFVKIPSYWRRWQDYVSICLMLCLLVMIILDPTVRCAKWSSDLFDDHCPEGEAMFPYYKPVSTCAALLYFWLLSDLAVLSTRLASFVLVCFKVASEVLLTLTALTFFVLAFASAMSSLNHGEPDLKGIPTSTVSLFRISFGMFPAKHFDEMLEWPSLFAAIVIFNLITVTFLSNLLIAQLNCAYMATYKDMEGFARLNRGKVVAETMPSVPRERFEGYVQSLRLEQRIEFGEGDVGLAGGVQVLEPSSLNITTVDSIRRFGGTTSPDAQWPVDDKAAGADEVDKFERLEKHLDKAMKRLGRGRKGGGGRGSEGTSGMTSGMSSVSGHDYNNGSEGSSGGHDGE